MWLAMGNLLLTYSMHDLLPDSQVHNFPKKMSKIGVLEKEYTEN